ncbi:MAG: hypothetical protein LBU90_03170 [Bacteroidales bacterium]|jgi:hypothetical protein|nr:hypothetical protein [Bacteroidales bacterium]
MSNLSLYKSRSFQEIFADTGAFLQQEWRSFFLCIVFYAAPVAAVANYFNTRVKNPFDFESKEMLTFLVFAVVSNFLLQSVSYCYMACYAQSGSSPSRHNVWDYFSKNIFTCLKAFFLSNAIIGLGLLLFVVPGMIALLPFSLYAVDTIFTASPSRESLTRSVTLTQHSMGMGYATVLLCYAIIFALQITAGVAVGKASSGVQVLVTTALSIVSTVMYIVIAILYCSLSSKTQKTYDDNQ